MPALTRKRKAELAGLTASNKVSQSDHDLDTGTSKDTDTDRSRSCIPMKRRKQAKPAARATTKSSTPALSAALDASEDIVISQANVEVIAARSDVFQTTELLESILLHLEPRNLWVIQRTSKRFRDTIFGSPHLQEALFLRLRAKSLKLEWASESSGLYDKSPRLYRVSSGATLKACEDGKNARLITPVRLNMIMQVVTGGERREHDSNIRITRYVHEEVAPTTYIELRKQESWQQMYISDPAPTKARIDLRWIIKTGVSGSVIRQIEDSNGITFAALLSAAFHQSDGGGHWAVGFWTDMETKGNHERVTLNVLLDRLEEKYGKKARLVHSMPCIIKLSNMVAPSPAEWKAMH